MLREFLDTAKNVTDAETLTNILIQWLSDHHRAARHVIGIDVASVRTGRGRPVPVVYRLMNADSIEGEPSRHFRCYELRPPQPFEDELDRIVIPAGDINANFWVDEVRAAMRNAAQRTGYSLPDTAEGVAGWLPVIVRSVSDMYQSLSIGGRSAGPYR